MSDLKPQPRIARADGKVVVTIEGYFPRRLFWGILCFVWLFAVVGGGTAATARWGPEPEEGGRFMPQLIGCAFIGFSLLFTILILKAARDVVIVEADAVELRRIHDGLFFRTRRRWPVGSVSGVVGGATGRSYGDSDEQEHALTVIFRNGDSKPLVRVGSGRDLHPAALELSKILGRTTPA